MSEPLESVLARFAPFAGADPARLRAAARYARLLSIPAGRTLLRPGRRHAHRHYLVYGRVLLEHGAERLTVRAGSTRARQPLVADEDDAVRVTTLSRCRVLWLDGAALALLLPDVLPAFAAEMPDPGHWMTRLVGARLLARFDAHQLAALLRAFGHRCVDAGETVVQAGEHGESFYVVKRGRAEVRRPMPVACRGPGEFFGEDALLTRARRNATVVMRSAGALAVLDRQDFLKHLVAPVMAGAEPCGHRIDVAVPASAADVRDFAAGILRGRRYRVLADETGPAALLAFMLQQRGIDAVPARRATPHAGTVRSRAHARRASIASPRSTEIG